MITHDQDIEIEKTLIVLKQAGALNKKNGNYSATGKKRHLWAIFSEKTSSKCSHTP